ncbi:MULTISPECIES: hypothetical protein [unclassified Azospirillum]|uniref:hypothetical protein n=1 Tax=unclassified Azospirillum TaxID=2630922 RepID=UPI000B67C679|nr:MULTISPECIES: hypothetical protein [unclassified Azospirillum]SNS24174.1 hypothetical protein SAMN05880556_103120 [Azospirillum sp. RU38E]SNS42511.1 hypothetical protein SAMN05880591_103120 [Azospirillum sp. RU37A]
MAKKKAPVETGHVLFDVYYQDGQRTSNRKVPRALVGGLDGEDPVRGFIEEQDREIAQMSGKPRGPIKSISRSPN